MRMLAEEELNNDFGSCFPFQNLNPWILSLTSAFTSCEVGLVRAGCRLGLVSLWRREGQGEMSVREVTEITNARCRW